MAVDRRRTVGVEGRNGLQSPRLALLAFFFRPDDRFPVRRQDQPRAGVGDFDAVAGISAKIVKEIPPYEESAR